MLLAYFLEHNRYLNFFGVITILAIAVAFSKNRRSINVRLIFSALLMQSAIAFFVLKTQPGYAIIAALAHGISQLYGAAQEGINFVFGSLGMAQNPTGFVFAFQVLPIIIFFGAFMSLLFYLGLVQRVVAGLNYVIQPLLGTSGAETLCAIANSFLGQTEAPLLIKHYIKNMTKSEMLVVMVSGMGTISGALLAVYSAMGVPAIHLLSASVMAIPATILIAKILYPDTEKQVATKHNEKASVAFEMPTGNLLDTIAQGTTDGLYLALNVGAMLIAFIALIGMINSIFGYFCAHIGFPCLRLQDIFAYLFAPFGWLLGLTGDEVFKAGELIGTKVAVNEMVAFSMMIGMNLSVRAQALLTYALCGFSNFSCIGIQLGGIGVLAPSQRTTLSELGLYAVLGGTLANLLSAMIAGLIL